MTSSGVESMTLQIKIYYDKRLQQIKSENAEV
jgi:hypothetical protein